MAYRVFISESRISSKLCTCPCCYLSLTGYVGVGNVMSNQTPPTSIKFPFANILYKQPRQIALVHVILH